MIFLRLLAWRYFRKQSRAAKGTKIPLWSVPTCVRTVCNMLHYCLCMSMWTWIWLHFFVRNVIRRFGKVSAQISIQCEIKSSTSTSELECSGKTLQSTAHMYIGFGTRDIITFIQERRACKSELFASHARRGSSKVNFHNRLWHLRKKERLASNVDKHCVGILCQQKNRVLCPLIESLGPAGRTVQLRVLQPQKSVYS